MYQSTYNLHLHYLLETGGDPPFHMALRIGGAGDDEGFQTLLSGNAVNKRIASETRCSGFQAGTRMAERVHEVLPSNACLCGYIKKTDIVIEWRM